MDGLPIATLLKVAYIDFNALVRAFCGGPVCCERFDRWD